MNKELMREIHKVFGDVYDPLIIELNRKQYWRDDNWYDIVCDDGLKIDENYLSCSASYQNPISQSYWKIKKVSTKVKYTRIELVNKK